MFWEILKASKGLPVTDQYAALWGKKIAGGWKVTEITGELPLIFRSDGSVLVDYRIYGTSAGAGVQTENLWDGNFEQGGMYGGSDRPPTDSNYYKRCRTIGYIDLEAQTEYTLVSSNYQIYCYAYKDEVYVSNQILEQWSKSHSISTSSSFNQIRLMIGNDDLTQKLLVDDVINDIMIVKGSTAPASYIPFGYKLPLTVTSGEQSDTYSVYIGDTKLYEDEYVDYQEQKVYKRTENLWGFKQFEEEFYNNDGNLIIQTGQYRTQHTDLIPTNDCFDYTISGLWHYANPYDSKFAVYEWDENKNWLRRSNRQDPVDNTPITFNIGTDAKYISFQVKNNDTDWNTNVMLVKGSTPPDHYIPYLQPTDPPVPLPAISTYQGENTLSSTETLGEVTVKGRIKEVDS